MTMDKPHPRVVGPKGDGNVPAGGQQDHVATRWIVEIEGAIARLVVEGRAVLGEHDHVAAVPVERMAD
jgi:hypothetical protein